MIKVKAKLVKDSVELKLSQRASLQVTTDLNSLIDVLTWFDQFQNALLPYETWLQCQLAVAEGFTNAVRHAHQGKPSETPIDIEVQIHDETLEIRIWDQGPGFDLDRHLKTRPLKVDASAEGGRGIGLIRQIADDLSYTRADAQRNCLHMVKHFS